MTLSALDIARPINVRPGQEIYSRATALYPSLRVTKVGGSTAEGTTDRFQAKIEAFSDNLRRRGFMVGAKLNFRLAEFATLHDPVWHAQNGRWCVAYEREFGGSLVVTGPESV